jgi:hypothetical protein
VTVVPPTTSFDEIMALNPDGIFLSNGPGDPAATGDYAVPVIQQAIKSKLPVFGICLGHQMMALALGGQTAKMPQGHHGANHPVMDHTTGKVEITSMNHGFTVDADSLPETVEQTHVSLFDGTNLRAEAEKPAGLLGAIPPRGLSGPPGQPLSVHPLCQSDPRAEGSGAKGRRQSADQGWLIKRATRSAYRRH